MARPRRKDRSWLVLAAAFVGAGAIGGTLLLLMRGMFSVGEDMLASTEDSRPLSGRQRLPADAVHVRATEHVDAPQAPISAESSVEPAGATILVAGRVVIPDGVPSDEHAKLRLDAARENGEFLGDCELGANRSFRFEVPRGAGDARLSLRSRYLCFAAIRVSLERSSPELVLEPKIGGCIRCCVVPEPGIDVPQPAGAQLWRFDGPDGARQEWRSGDLDANGCLEFGGLDPAQRFAVTTFDPRLRPLDLGPIVPIAGRVVDVPLSVIEPVEFDLHVIDSQGADLPGARCRVFEATRDQSDRLVDERVSTPDARLRATLYAADGIRVVVSKPGFIARTLDLERPRAPVSLSVALERAIPLRGRVTWPAGQPAAGASVFADDERDPDASPSMAFVEDDGDFELDDLGEGPYTLSARARRSPGGRIDGASDGIDAARSRHATTIVAHVERSAQDVALVLRADVGIRGRIVDEEGHPWTRVRVAARPVSAGSYGAEANREVADVFADENGRYELRGLHAGGWDVRATYSNFDAVPRRVEIGATDERVDLVLERGTRISGVVLDERGAPITRARVEVLRLDRERGGVREATCTTVEAGRFSFQRVPQGPVALLVFEDRILLLPPYELDLPRGTTRENVELRIPPAAIFRGMVVDADGRPVSNARIGWTREFDRRWGERFAGVVSSVPLDAASTETQANADGRFETRAMLPGKYVVHAANYYAHGCFVEVVDRPQVSESHEVEVRAGETTDLRLELRPLR